MDTTVLRVQFTLISPVLFDVMLVRRFNFAMMLFVFIELVNLIDVLAHRQLSAAIGYSPLHASLHSKSHVERILDVVNRRHRMAQMAGRASVEFYVGLALKGRGEKERKIAGQEVQVTEEAFVIRTFRNGLGVFVSKSVYTFLVHELFYANCLCDFFSFFVSRLGIEGLVMFKRDTQFDAENYTITVPSSMDQDEMKMIGVFDKVKVRIEVEKDKNTQRGRVKMTLVQPVDSRNL